MRCSNYSTPAPIRRCRRKRPALILVNRKIVVDRPKRRVTRTLTISRVDRRNADHDENQGKGAAGGKYGSPFHQSLVSEFSGRGESALSNDNDHSVAGESKAAPNKLSTATRVHRFVQVSRCRGGGVGYVKSYRNRFAFSNGEWSICLS